MTPRTTAEFLRKIASNLEREDPQISVLLLLHVGDDDEHDNMRSVQLRMLAVGEEQLTQSDLAAFVEVLTEGLPEEAERFVDELRNVVNENLQRKTMS